MTRFISRVIAVRYKQGMDRKWHASVRIHRVMYNQLKSYFLDMATCRSLGQIRLELLKLPFEPYAPVRKQLLNIRRAVNRARKRAGYEAVPLADQKAQKSIVLSILASFWVFARVRILSRFFASYRGI